MSPKTLDAAILVDLSLIPCFLNQFSPHLVGKSYEKVVFASGRAEGMNVLYPVINQTLVDITNMTVLPAADVYIKS
ncbi:hypothetical protein OUZ56_000288 [Daphnia magna]|uniref:Uncharacterized protein n=1 Tax=Daphnia magna TaxID=35525 RepID=A0ABQ9ZZW6_9CRUS|nr:hypothetical protein OUZ56_000288 [Daphnia magna]